MYLDMLVFVVYYIFIILINSDIKSIIEKILWDFNFIYRIIVMKKVRGGKCDLFFLGKSRIVGFILLRC